MIDLLVAHGSICERLPGNGPGGSEMVLHL